MIVASPSVKVAAVTTFPVIVASPSVKIEAVNTPDKKLTFPSTFKLFLIDTPPSTINAPDEEEVVSVVFIICVSPSTCRNPSTVKSSTSLSTSILTAYIFEKRLLDVPISVPVITVPFSKVILSSSIFILFSPILIFFVKVLSTGTVSVPTLDFVIITPDSPPTDITASGFGILKPFSSPLERTLT